MTLFNIKEHRLERNDCTRVLSKPLSNERLLFFNVHDLHFHYEIRVIFLNKFLQLTMNRNTLFYITLK